MLRAAFGDQDAFHETQELPAAVSAEDERAPGDAQADAEGRGVGTVAADVADDRVQEPVIAFDDVEEVTATATPARNHRRVVHAENLRVLSGR